MNNIEQKALELVNEAAGSGSWTLTSLSHPYNRVVFTALCRVIERHEAFRQEVSDAVQSYYGPVHSCMPHRLLAPFIIHKSDPLVDAMNDSLDRLGAFEKDEADRLRAALAKRGGRIVFDD